MLRLTALRRRLRGTPRTAAAAASLSTLRQLFRRDGHRVAALDPLRLPEGASDLCADRETAQRLGLLEDAERAGHATPAAGMPEGDAGEREMLRQVYCGPIGVEFEHVEVEEEREWIARRMESMRGDPVGAGVVTDADRRNAAVLMLQAEVTEGFLAKRYSSFKRYSGEGAEIMQPVLDTIFKAAARSGVQDVVVGMPHRGRLAFLLSQLNYPATRLFHKVNGFSEIPDNLYALDDVTSHISASVDKGYGADSVHVTLLNNPSHLEIIGAVAAGKVRAKMDDGSEALCVQVHGDAAMAGQGCVPETLALAPLDPFTVKGTVHVVVNNQLGFTTAGTHGRGGRYCTDVAKQIGAPVLHVNGECVEHALAAAKLATEYRQRFGKDVFLDLVVYRRHGHNEVDEPAFTQPIMYDTIRSRPLPPETYLSTLEQEGTLSKEKVETLRERFHNHMAQAMEAAKDFDKNGEEEIAGLHTLQGRWSSVSHSTGPGMHTQPMTGAPMEALQGALLASVHLPEDFTVHRRLKTHHIDARLKSCLEKNKVDWASAEAMAMGTLIAQGFNVRICGQDSGRGTFSHRHAIMTDQKTGAQYMPFQDMPGRQGRIDVVNSNLSELAVMGFEHGYSIESPQNLVLWEAQFGDFANGAQIIVDQFHANSDIKWLKQSAMTLLLPHGFDNAGPEHSSARIERFLQLCDIPGLADAGTDIDDTHNTNMIVAHPTTPANYFHILRRQMLRPFRKPMVIIAPKTVLRLAAAVSKMEDMATDTQFQPVLADPSMAAGSEEAAAATRVVLCSGKFYYDLVKQREAAQDTSTAIVRIEELNPFPHRDLRQILADTYPAAERWEWVQEEPLNAGPWMFVEPQIRRLLRQNGVEDYRSADVLSCSSRPSLALTAVGTPKHNAAQTQELLQSVFAVPETKA